MSDEIDDDDIGIIIDNILDTEETLMESIHVLNNRLNNIEKREIILMGRIAEMEKIVTQLCLEVAWKPRKE